MSMKKNVKKAQKITKVDRFLTKARTFLTFFSTFGALLAR